MMETIEIALASDHNYFPGLLVTAASMARHASRDYALRFNVLDGGLTETDWTFLREKVAAEHPHAELRRLPVDEGRFKVLPEWSGSTRMVYARLMLPELLPDAEFVLHSDVDFLWTADVSELWNLRDRTQTVQGCRDLNAILHAREVDWFAQHGMVIDIGRYICAGMMLMNLKRFRELHVAENLMDFLREHLDAQYLEQTAINAIVKDIGLLPQKWGRYSYELRASELRGEWAIHFAGDAPWKWYWWTQLLNPAWKLWHRFYGEMYGIGERESLGRIYGTGAIAKRKFAYWVVHAPVVRTVFFAFLRLARRGGYVPFLKDKVTVE